MEWVDVIDPMEIDGGERPRRVTHQIQGCKGVDCMCIVSMLAILKAEYNLTWIENCISWLFFLL